ncbi:hypothetical protein A6A08_16305 [Nocardiopsis sp. TSRI0078]|uniref:hypothetical protein n=1 Tax=unclassified Nocardiopsis TaxID=2649073 RepID=UPI00093F352F|nr:hypothetical protein [Nocardiopsis sp. TSRI0078]OKI13004.1 hypothetical protein A6A08_16305 [Nocardiopsis sp. TSRI0078]
MSWDVLLTPVPVDAESVDDIPEGLETGPIAPLARLLATLRGAFPAADLSDPAWGHLQDEEQGWAMELDIGTRDPVGGVMLHVRGGGDVVPTALRMAEVLGCRAIDCSTGDFLREDGAGWESFQDYRDRVLLQASPEKTGPSTAS